MKKILFLTDLDNTILYSRAHFQQGDRCIEWIHEAEQGYMSEKTIEMLNKIPEYVQLIPVTSRSIAQYRRIQWPCAAPQRAVCTNGAVLLNEGIEDGNWRIASEMLIAPCRVQLIELEQRLTKWDRFLRVRMVDNTYLFAYCRDGVCADEALKDIGLPEGISIQISGRKIYFLPTGLHKGFAARRLMEHADADLVIAAGDSIMDLPMLALADIALVPDEALGRNLKEGKTHICPQNSLFMEFILSSLLEKC